MSRAETKKWIGGIVGVMTGVVFAATACR